MRCRRKGGLSAITKVKVYSPEIINIAQGQGFHFLEARIVECVSGEHINGVPGSKSMAGNPTVHSGTWENHIVSNKASNRAEEARRKYGGMVVGLTRSRGVTGVMAGEGVSPLEGVSGRTQRGEVTYATY